MAATSTIKGRGALAYQLVYSFSQRFIIHTKMHCDKCILCIVFPLGFLIRMTSYFRDRNTQIKTEELGSSLEMGWATLPVVLVGNTRVFVKILFQS